MAGKGYKLNLYRGLLREMRRIYGKDNMRDAPACLYLKDQFRKYQVTGQKFCRDKADMQHKGETYLCLLESTRKHEELSLKYKGRGERTIQESAQLVGLALPQEAVPPEQK